jgi:zinc/manganese transport system substrate-binding protein
MGALVKSVAGSRANLTVLAGQNRDLHTLQAKPTMMHALRGADLAVAIGAELEVGWLPVAIQGAANPKILPGKNGYFEAAAQVPLLDAGGAANRALGDVHPVGNPHVNMDPVRMATIARALANRLALIDSAGASQYRRGADTFAAKVDRRVRSWRGQLSGAPGVVLYHRDAIYLLDRFGVPLLGTIEPIPGVPPTGRQISALTSELEGRSGIIIYAPYQSAKAPKSLAGNLGWRVVQLPMEPPKGADGDSYLGHIGRWVNAIASAR